MCITCKFIHIFMIYTHTCVRILKKIELISDLVHLTTSSTGRVVTLDRRLGRVLWKLDLKSPVIAMYTVTKDGLLTIPFTSIADSLLEKFATDKPTDIQLL